MQLLVRVFRSYHIYDCNIWFRAGCLLVDASPMNKQYIQFNLEEAQMEIEQALDDLRRDATFDEYEYNASMSNIYHYLNTAWNARNASISEVSELSDDNFYLWREFPSLDELFLEEYEIKTSIRS